VLKMSSEQVTIAGFGGQGVMMIGQMLAYAATEDNLHTLWFPSYGPETRGGTANCSVTISEKEINSPIFSHANTLIALNNPSLLKFANKVKKNGVILYNSSLISDPIKVDDVRMIGIPVNDISMQLGNPRVANMVMMGAYLEITKLFQEETIIKILKKFMGKGKEHLIDINITALDAGRQYILKLER
jgi:2-oxoglutarate ferredoxin oxidoreductase subunit gamma